MTPVLRFALDACYNRLGPSGVESAIPETHLHGDPSHLVTGMMGLEINLPQHAATGPFLLASAGAGWLSVGDEHVNDMNAPGEWVIRSDDQTGFAFGVTGGLRRQLWDGGPSARVSLCWLGMPGGQVVENGSVRARGTRVVSVQLGVGF